MNKNKNDKSEKKPTNGRKKIKEVLFEGIQEKEIKKLTKYLKGLFQ